MVTVITAQGNKTTLDKKFVMDNLSKYDLIGNTYFEKREEKEEIQEKKPQKTVEVSKEETISPKEEVVIAPMPESEEPTDDELRAFLKEKNVKSVHLFGRAKLIAKAEEYGFIFNK